MKKLLLIFSAFILNFQLSLAVSNEELLKQANDFYKNQQYEKAIEAYEKVLTNGYEAAELYYNLGNAYFKSNKITYAILNYERAKLLEPNNEDINFNLKIANQHVVDAIETVPDFFLFAWIKQLLYSKSSDFWAILSIVSFAILLTFSLTFLFGKQVRVKKISFVLGLVFAFLTISTFYFSYKQRNILVNRNSAIVISPAITVKSSPNKSGTDLFVIHEGLKVYIEDNSGEWIEIILKDGRKGWLLASSIAVI